MKKVLSLLASVAICGTSFAAVTGKKVEGPSKNGKLQIIGKQLCNESGAAVQLKGWSTFSTQYPEGTDCLENKNAFTVMKGWGANVCRIAMYADETPNGGGYIQNPGGQMATVKEYVMNTIENDMYAVIDWHILETSNNTRQPAGDPNTYKDDAIKFFKEISAWVVKSDYNGKVLYELCNEPTVNFARIKEYAEPVMDAVLANDEDALFIVGTESWCQKILDATNNPLNKKYADKALYSFHYYACSHENLLGNFSAACAKAPCIVSEWSTVSFSGDGASCWKQSDRLMSYCDGGNNGKQLVSWFFWSWGKKAEGSAIFYGQDCSNPSGLESKLSETGRKSVEWVSGDAEIKPVPVPTNADPNVIPSNWNEMILAFDWKKYDDGGEGVAYHDGNGDAYDKDLKKGFYIGYNNRGAEVDALSVARDFETGQNKTMGLNPDFKYDADGNVQSYSGSNTVCWDWSWDNGGACTGKNFPATTNWPTLNSGLFYGRDGLFNSDHLYDGVDISKCSGTYSNGGGKPGYSQNNDGTTFVGTDALGNEITGDRKIKEYTLGNLANTEPDEWISYTVDVKKAGYYRVDALVQGSTDETGEMTISLVGDNGGNIIRDLNAKEEFEKYSTVSFMSDYPNMVADDYDNWMWSGMMSGSSYGDENREVGIVFRHAGKQQIIVSTTGSVGNLGPLFFILVDEDVQKEIDGNTKVVKNVTSDFTIYPNPTSGEFTVKLAGEETGSVEVYNIAGQVVYSAAIAGQSEITVNKKLASGVYTVAVTTENGTKTQKLAVK